MTLTASTSATELGQHASEPGSVRRARERTPWLLVVVCFLVPALPSYVVPAGPLKSNGSPARLITLLLFALVVLGFIASRRTTSRRNLQPGLLIILAYLFLQLIVYAVGLLNPSSPLLDASRTRTLIMMVSYVGMAVYTVTRIKTMRERSIVFGSLAVGLTFACVVALLQDTVDLRYLFQPPGFVVNTEFTELAVRLGATRVQGTSGHPIEFSVLAAAAVPITLHFARYAVSAQTRVFAAIACGLCLLALPAAVSRSGLVCLACAFLVYLWTFKIQHLVLTVGLAIAATTAYFLLFQARALALLDTILNSEQDPSVLTRTTDYATVGDTFRAHPIFGLGLGGSPPATYGFLDNEWLQALVQGGTVGFTAMLLLAVGGLFGFCAALRSATSVREKGLAYAMGAAYAAVLSSTVTFDLFSYQQASLLFFLLFGLMWSTYRIPIAEVNAVPDTDNSPPA